MFISNISIVISLCKIITCRQLAFTKCDSAQCSQFGEDYILKLQNDFYI